MTPTNEIGMTRGRYWELSDAELEDFFKEMGSERVSMSLTLDQLRSAWNWSAGMRTGGSVSIAISIPRYVAPQMT